MTTPIDRLRAWLSARIAPASRAPAAPRVRLYHNARVTRATTGWYAAETSADAELEGSLTSLRNRSRALVRDAAYAKRAKVIVVNNVIGPGVGMQAQIQRNGGRLAAEINDPLEAAWGHWSRAAHCHTGGKLNFSDLERLCLGQIFEAGEILIRKHYRRFGESRIPLGLEIIEAERLADRITVAPTSGNDVRLGVEGDGFGRPVAYWLRTGHPGDARRAHAGSEQLERVPADQIWHLYIVDRWPQSRGEPWLHATARRLNDMDGYSEAEIIAARNSAASMGFIESEADALNTATMVDEVADDGEQISNFEPGIIHTLRPGQSYKEHNPSRPNTALDPFLRYMLREVAAGIGVSYESLSRDYSQSNYSSSRLALLDDRDLWRTLQLWWIRNFREPLHREWLRLAVYAGAISTLRAEQYLGDPAKWEAVKFKPRGWSWIDPAKEVQAKVEAVKAGFTTVGKVIAETADGDDLEDILEARRAELDMMEDLGLRFTSDPELEQPAAAPAAPADPDPADPDAAAPDAQDRARVIAMRTHA